MKKKWLVDSCYLGIQKKWTRVMRLSVILIIGFVVTVNANSYSQVTRFDIKMQNQTIIDLIQYVEKNSEFVFLYKNEDFNTDKKVSIDLKNATIYEILDEALEEENVVYDVYERQIIIRKAEKLNYTSTPQNNRKITGVVTDKSGLPLPGVSVMVKETNIGTVTGSEGNFLLTIPNNAEILHFSFVGMQAQDIPLSDKTEYFVVMEEESIGVDEVVVTALGIEKNKRTLTYVTQKVDMENLATVTKGDVGAALAGKIAGISVMTGTNGGSRIIIRGERSINGSNSPLIIMDGVPSNFGLGNVDDIESINVLKGPSASALYGAAAANGVIIVSTKKGKQGETKVEINSQTTFGLPYLYPKVQNVYGQGVGGVYNSSDPYYSWGPEMTGQTVTNWTGEEIALTPQPDNIKDLFRASYSLINSVSYSTGTKKSTAYFSYTNKTNQGLIPVNTSGSHMLNMRLDTELLKNLSLDVVTTWSHDYSENTPLNGDDLFSPMWQLVKMPRSIRTADIEAGYYFDATGSRKQLTWIPSDVVSNVNPYWSMYGREAFNKGTNLNTVASLRYNFTSWLYIQLRGRMAYNYSNSEEKYYWDTQYINSGKGDYSKSSENSRNLNADILLGFDKDITKDWHLSANLGSEIKDSQYEGLESDVGGLGLVLENKFYLENGSSVSSTDYQSHTQIQSVYGTAQIGFRNYLFLDGTARTDWSSTLPSPYYYFYPSVGLTSVISDIVDLPDAISYFKVRGSYAEVGNGAGFAQIFQTYSRTLNGTQGLVSPGSTKMPSNLIPEKTKSWEAGTEIRLLKDRLGIDLTLYKANTYNQLVSVTSPPTSGFSNALINCGNIQNKGIEIMLNAVPVQTSDWKWDIGFNFTRNWSEVIELTPNVTEYEIAAPNLSIGDNWIIVGRPYGEILSRGFVRVKDIDETRPDDNRVVVDNLGMPSITTESKTSLGNFNYMWKSGLTNSIKYKNWNLYFLIDLNYGGVRQSATEAQMMLSGSSVESLKGRDGFVYDGVRQITNEDGTYTFVENDIEITAELYGKAIGGRATNGSGEAFNHSATNSRLREFSIGYTIPVNKQIIKNITVSAIGRNLFYFYNGCEWFDPDVSYDLSRNGQGSESAFLPGTRNIGFNLKLTF